MRRTIRLLAAVTAVAAMTLASGCSDSGDKKTEASAAGGTLEKVSYLTGVGVQGRESYMYVAMDKGYFKDAGFEVEVRPGLGTGANLKTLQSGQADFAIVDITAALMEFGKGTFKDFTVTSAVHQRNLACFMAIEGRGVSTPKDLENKKIAYIPGGIVKELFPTYAQRAQINPAGIKWVIMPPQEMGKGMATGAIDAATQFVVGKPAIEAASKGKSKAVVLPFSDYLVDLYGNGLAVSNKAMKENPDRVKRFNQAMLKGLSYAIEHPDEAGKIYAKYQKAQPEQVATAEVQAMVPYVKASGSAIGQLDEQKVAKNIAVLQAAGAIPGAIDPKAVVNFDMVAKS